MLSTSWKVGADQHWAEEQVVLVMAHSGAGRWPVMMANGHVKDALDEKQRIDLEVGKEKKKKQTSCHWEVKAQALIHAR